MCECVCVGGGGGCSLVLKQAMWLGYEARGNEESCTAFNNFINIYFLPTIRNSLNYSSIKAYTKYSRLIFDPPCKFIWELMTHVYVSMVGV